MEKGLTVHCNRCFNVCPGGTGRLLNSNTEEDGGQRACGSGTARGWVDGRTNKRWTGRQTLLAVKEKGITLSSLPEPTALTAFKSKAATQLHFC